MLKEFLTENKENLRQRWFDLIVDTYPAGAAKFLKSKKNEFANPVGSTIESEIGVLLDGLLVGAGPDELKDGADGVVRIRAVQDFAPSSAVSFVFMLKQAYREIASDMLSDANVLIEARSFEDEIDRLALVVFDTYMACREQIFQLRVGEIKDRSAMLQERMHRVQISEDSDRKEENNNNES